MQPSEKNEHSAVRWAVIGTGEIAALFASQLPHVKGAHLYAVSSRSSESADAFAKHHGFENAFKGLHSLCTDASVDVAYVATPTRTHEDIATRLIDAGVAVVCEKPFGRTEQEAGTIINRAQAADIFCMEAMWMRFNPLVKRLKDAIRNNEVGQVKTVTASLGYKKPLDQLGTASEGRGALLAFGCYGVSLALHLFGIPDHVQWSWKPNPKGGDAQAVLTFSFADVLMSFTCSETATLDNDVRVHGTDGYAQLNAPFIDATALEIVNLGDLQSRSLWERLQGKIERTIGPILGHSGKGQIRIEAERYSGFRLEAQEATDCIRKGKKESSIIPLSHTRLVHEILDAALASPYGTWHSAEKTQ